MLLKKFDTYKLMCQKDSPFSYFILSKTRVGSEKSGVNAVIFLEFNNFILFLRRKHRIQQIT